MLWSIQYLKSISKVPCPRSNSFSFPYHQPNPGPLWDPMELPMTVDGITSHSQPSWASCLLSHCGMLPLLQSPPDSSGNHYLLPLAATSLTSPHYFLLFSIHFPEKKTKQKTSHNNLLNITFWVSPSLLSWSHLMPHSWPHWIGPGPGVNFSKYPFHQCLQSPGTWCIVHRMPCDPHWEKASAQPSPMPSILLCDPHPLSTVFIKRAHSSIRCWVRYPVLIKFFLQPLSWVRLYCP